MRWCPSSSFYLLRCVRLRTCTKRRRNTLPLWIREIWAYIRLLVQSFYFNSLTDSDVVFDSVFEPVFWTVDYITRWFGTVFVFLVVVLTSSILVIAYLFVLPMVFRTYSTAWITWHVCYGHWNLVMIVFNYYKATMTHPGHPPTRFKHTDVEKPGVPVTGMGVLIGLLPPGQTNYQTAAPPYTFKDKMINKSIIYMWVLTSTVAVALGALTCWHAVLISRGETSIERHLNHREKERMEKGGRVYKNPFDYGRLNNWKVFFGVQKRSHWLTRVLLPSGHTPSGDGLTWEAFPVKKDVIPADNFTWKQVWRWQANCRRMHNLADWISGTVMGGCVGRNRMDGQGSARSSTRSKKRGGRNEPLKKERPKWKCEYPMTEGQLRSKRDEFWDTAPAFDGRKEIWDALRAAALAAEGNDLELAQAIVDGACITLPHGSLTESYDELGNRYQLPGYTLAPPANLISETSSECQVSDSSQKQAQPAPCREEFQLRVRLSSGQDVRLTASLADSIAELKKQLEVEEDIAVTRQRWFFSGKLLIDKTRLQDAKIQKDFVVQVIVNMDPPAIAN
ncbi:hypothetical protein KUCAC02_023659 [Chaenocephalus aceratus]|uniref:Uncharacterized protein n=1 Tax=Chaenocephalus aceratus TaxID=36190 RepID=A0ACB9WFJ9_CHAAC|nr:hypothetical protein KUCAC02_023659 [Chaenocephalus aceratus]